MTVNKILEEDLDCFVNHFPFAEACAGKTFFITGATGLLGSLFVKSLLRLNEVCHTEVRIVATARNREKVRQLFGEAPVEWHFQDVTEPVVLPERPVDYIVHLAGPTDSQYFTKYPVETLRTVVEGTRSVLEYARTAGCRSMVYASSLEVYGTNGDDRLLNEDFQGYVAPTDVRSSYNIGKRTAECLCHAYSREYGVPVRIARLTQTFGAGASYDDRRVFAQFARRLVEGEAIELHTEGRTCRMYCYTIDAIRALFYLLMRGADGEAYNVANPESYISIRELAELLVKEFGEGSRVVMHLRNDRGYAPETKLKLDTSKLESLGWRPCFDLKQMFGRLLAYYEAISTHSD